MTLHRHDTLRRINVYIIASVPIVASQESIQDSDDDTNTQEAAESILNRLLHRQRNSKDLVLVLR